MSHSGSPIGCDKEGGENGPRALGAVLSWNLWGIPLFSERLHTRALRWRDHALKHLSEWEEREMGEDGDDKLVVACFQEAWGFRAGCGAACLHAAFSSPPWCRSCPRLGCARALNCCVRGRRVDASDCEFAGMLTAALCGRWCCPCVLWDVKRFLLPRQRGASCSEQRLWSASEEGLCPAAPPTLRHAVGLSGASMGTVAEQRCAARLLDSGLVMLANHACDQWGFLPFPPLPQGEERLARKGVLWAYWRGTRSGALVLTTHLAASVPQAVKEEQLQIVADLAATLRDRLRAEERARGCAAPIEVVIAGDLNIQAHEPELDLLRRAGLERVAAPGRTSLSGKVIDHVFCMLAGGRRARARGPVEQDALLSDHLPIGASVADAEQ